MSTTAEKKYQTSFEDCQKTITGICSCCGGELNPIETVDNSGNPTWWAGCESCNRFDSGVSREVYAIATYMVEELSYTAYPTMTRPKKDEPKYADYYHKSQIGGTVSLVDKILRIQKRLSASKNEQATV